MNHLERTACAAGLILLLSLSTACDVDAESDASSVQAQNGNVIVTRVVDQINLPLLDTVVMPTLDESTAWLQNHNLIFPSKQPDRLWAIDPINVAVTQFSLAGVATRILDKRGQGPRELQGPRDIAELGATLLVFDVRAPRVAAFDAGGELEFEIPLQPPVSSFTLLAEDEVAVVPGTDHLVDVYSMDGVTRSIGPVRGDSLICRWCKIAALPGGRILVAQPDVPRLYVLDGETGAWRVVDLRNDVMAEWQSTFAADRRYENNQGRAAGISLKNWIGQIVEVTDDSAFLLMFSPRPGPDGNEVWKVHLGTGATVRYLLSGEPIQSIARQGDYLYGLLPGNRGRGIVRFTAPTI